MARQSCTARRTRVLVGNKIDLERSRQVSNKEGKDLATSYDAKFIETSAGLKHNVDELLVGVLKQILLRQQQAEEGVVAQRRRARGKSCTSLITLRMARAALLRMCLTTDERVVTKSCENLHVL